MTICQFATLFCYSWQLIFLSIFKTYFSDIFWKWIFFAFLFQSGRLIFLIFLTNISLANQARIYLVVILINFFLPFLLTYFFTNFVNLFFLVNIFFLFFLDNPCKTRLNLQGWANNLAFFFGS